MAAIESAKLDDVRLFHARYYGPIQATMVVVGDFDLSTLRGELGEAFENWSGGVKPEDFPKAQAAGKKQEEVIAMADKPNVTVMIGEATGLMYKDPEALALRVGTSVLGSGFTGRLMANVRDKEGLTYGIGASVADDSFADGTWRITANFAPDLLEKGMASTQRQLDLWYKDGITSAELERVKSNLIGTFKVGLATTDGLAAALLNAVQRGYDPSWLDEYPKRLEALTLEEVNGAIKKHIRPESLTVIKAGTIPTGKAAE